MNLRFVSKNKYKIEEVKKLLKDSDINIIPFEYGLEELQTENTNKLLKDKVLKAFAKVGRPLIVEHTGIYIESLNGFPGGLTQIFWDTIQAENFSSIFGTLDNVNVQAKTIIGYCDGMRIHYFEGVINGKISREPLGKCDFQWDCVFIPEGHTETFAQMGEKKNDISMRKIAFDNFIEFLKDR